MMIEVVKLFVVVIVTVKFTEACNGYHIKINRIETCIDNSIIQPKNIAVNLDKDCNIVYGGCLEFTKPVKTMMATYEISKAPLPLITGDLDMCQLAGTIKMPQLLQIVNGFGFPKKCPIAAKKFCATGNKSISIAKFKNQLSMAAGLTELKLNIDHDNGKSCVAVSLTVSKR
ncbi:unnamed protein product [Psylliodes chrysocephalus]|uniref:MD-2-related lipid-recognition domain-containing protein n=1 Tax=Psylliodes chrysocephalus TaxID=3402493 RepID=A0A9P0CL07_9CUCU|nr:unnamed protein product [Psylliodes chrysocephala]